MAGRRGLTARSMARRPGGALLPPAQLPVPDRVDLGHGMAEEHDLGPPVTARLEQHRVHPRVRLDARRRCLHGLGPPISAPPAVAKEFSDMFWALNGATRTPCRARQRHSPATIMPFPASEPVPATR